MDTEQKTTQVPPQEVVDKLSRLSTLLADVKRMASEYWEAYRLTIELGVSETDWHQTLDIRCGDYVMFFNTRRVYLVLRTPYGEEYRVLDNGKGSVGDILSVPIQCWDALIRAVENLIREKVNKIEYLRKLYHIYTATF
jgi:hypothetical protein